MISTNDLIAMLHGEGTIACENAATRLEVLDRVAVAARSISRTLDEFDGDYQIVDHLQWDGLWSALKQLDDAS